jgi:catechol 2,3-dioxygenase-like lactoylglutathione lyase family enzyme
MEKKIISGIQQIGIGVSNVKEAWKWYKDYFGMDIKIFEEAAMAELMLPYTGNKPRMRHAALTVNLMGGGGFEIWQFTERTPQSPKIDVKVGDLGIYAAKIKSRDVKATYKYFQSKNLNVNGLHKDPKGRDHFYIQDPFGNIFQIVDSEAWFKFDRKKFTGASAGMVIGSSEIDKSLTVYSKILGYDKVVYDKSGKFEDLNQLNGGHHEFRRVLLSHSKERLGGFSRLFGPSEVELIQVLDRPAEKIFKDRYWGDLGFIHICFDVIGMNALRKECFELGHTFTVDSDVHPKGNSFDMGEAAGHFAYIEDPDGTLIEFVETHKIPIMKKLGWYMDLKNRAPEKPLPNWILKALKYSKIKDKHLR